MRLRLVIAGLFLTVTFPLFSQVVPAATGSGGLPLSIGAGYALYNTDWGNSYMGGGALWIDWDLSRFSILRGFGIEAEARDISLNRPNTVPSNFRLDTAGGGFTYHLNHFRNLKPYAKFEVDYGSIDWNNPDPRFKHETRNVLAPGGGLDYRILRSVWLRADYEYQSWPDIDKLRPNSSHILDPNGLTIGALYDFRRRDTNSR
jgi:opacity protein-like surface antigen